MRCRRDQVRAPARAPRDDRHGWRRSRRVRFGARDEGRPGHPLRRSRGARARRARPTPEPATASSLVDVHAAGVNYADTHPDRRQLPGPAAPAVRAGRRGRRASPATARAGASSPCSAPAAATPSRRWPTRSLTFPLPDEVDDARRARRSCCRAPPPGTCCARRTRLGAGESVVVHAAAGGVGSLAVQLARQWGAARVIAHRVEPGASASWPCRSGPTRPSTCRRRARRGRACATCCATPTAGTTSTSSSR